MSNIPSGADPLARLARAEGVPAAVAAARDAADAVLRDRGLRRVDGEVVARALLRGAQCSAEIEGSEWLAGAIRVSTELVWLAPQLRREPGRVLARLHTLAARGVVADAELGKLRPGVSGRMADLHALLAGDTRAPALVLGAVAHAEVAACAAFGAGSGVVARAAERLVQISAGLDSAGVLVPEAGHLAAGEGYARGLAGYTQGGAGVRGWLLQCADAFVYGVEASPLVQR